MSRQTVRLSREQLYEQVWSEPIIHVAKRIGLSGRGLGKLCARYDVPVPPRGWWAKKQHGHHVRQSPLPACKDPRLQTIELNLRSEAPEHAPTYADAPEYRRENQPEWRI